MKKGMLYSIRSLLFISLALLGFGVETALAQTPEYATFSGGISGTGDFSCSEMPGFTYSITGDFAPGDTSVPGPAQTIDNNGAGFETIFGQADAQQNIEVEVAGFGGGNGGGIGAPITNTVTTTLDFDTPTPPGAFAFIIADVEQDQVMVCALDADGNSVPVSVIDTWFQASFDADNSDAATIAPSWDSATGTLVGQEGAGGVKQTTYVADLPDNEAGAAWFQVNISITQIQFKSQALGVNPDDPSQHFLFATTCEEPTCTDLLNEPTICDYIIDNPNSDLAQADCDGGGISNLIECQTGEDPSDPADDCMALMDAGIDVCAFLAANPGSPFGAQDCDNGGVDNLTECLANQDPKDPADDFPCPNPNCADIIIRN